MKMRVHNTFEAKVLIKEMLARGEDLELTGLDWFTHDGQYLFTSCFNGETINVPEDQRGSK